MRKSLPKVFPPGEFLREELEARGWSQSDFARVLGRPVQAVNEIIHARKQITAKTAKEIGAALGTGAELWLNLETTWQLAKAPNPDPRIEKRAALLAA